MKFCSTCMVYLSSAKGDLIFLPRNWVDHLHTSYRSHKGARWCFYAGGNKDPSFPDIYQCPMGLQLKIVDT